MAAQKDNDEDVLDSPEELDNNVVDMDDDEDIEDVDDESDDEPKKKTKAELAKDKKKSKKKEKTSEEMKVASHKLQQKRVINALAKADAELRLFLVSKPDIEQANECFFKLRESVYKRVKMLDEIQALKDS